MAGKRESTFVSMTSTLLVIAIISALSLGGVYSLTKDAIAEVKRAKLEKAIRQVVPDFDTLISFRVMPESGKDSVGVYQAYANNQWVGSAIETYSDKGFGGRIRIMAGFAPDGKIVNTAILEHTETPGLGDKMDRKKSDFPLQFIGKLPGEFVLKVKKDGGDVDAITAATISSRAFCDAMERASSVFKQKGGPQP